ncbi:MAG: hypothetical protein BWY78_00764 [Alphaproteobacteria bacterium ADurb.Bin438]|nr:MAG: hypothetical protein BWY78_00764 [Alphaproteobacteria bacterium ADurb.Bin438]
MFKLWYLVMLVMILQLVYASLVTLQMVKMHSMVNTLKMHKVKMLLLVSELHNLCQKLLRLRLWLVVNKTSHVWKMNSQLFMLNLLQSKTSLKNITQICKIWSLQLKKVNFGCCKQEMVKELLLLL